MNTLVQAPTKDFHLNYHIKSAFPEENQVAEYNSSPGLSESSLVSNGLSYVEEYGTSEGKRFMERDYPDATIKFISQMLMEEEDLAKKPCMLRSCLALQATEKSLYDVLNDNLDEDALSHYFTKLCSCDSIESSPSDSSTETCGCQGSGRSSGIGSLAEFNLNEEGEFEFSQVQDGDSTSPIWVPNSSKERRNGELLSPDSGLEKKTTECGEMVERNERDCSLHSLREKKNRDRADGDHTETQRSNKLSATNASESESLEMYDEVLLCPNSDFLMSELGAKKQLYQKQSKGTNIGRPRKGKKQGITTEVIDLRSLLMQCAQAVGSYDNKGANEILMQIRQNSSPYGAGTERLVHYFAYALEARLGGVETESYASDFSNTVSAAEILKAYKMFITACPFMNTSIYIANTTIQRLAVGATTLHIIDFGILHGYQWPCLIQALSERLSGPPKLRMTGIDFPQPGFRPAERIVDTGNRLKKYCKRFGVPFEFNAIAQKWETINLEDLKIEKNELLVVNSIYRLQNVPDETATANCPRDEVLNLIKNINPKIFIQGTINGTYNTPFFITRFREAFYYFSSMFDMFDATVPLDNEQRLLFEKEVLGKDAMNVIACEGTERVDRPETYKQWQLRNVRAGFRQLPLDQELVKYVKSKVKMHYHKDFLVDEDGKWMLQGWKGRVTHALSCWQPAN